MQADIDALSDWISAHGHKLQPNCATVQEYACASEEGFHNVNYVTNQQPAPGESARIWP